MVCSWALVLIRQDSGCPSKETCEQDAREKLASSRAPKGCIWGSYRLAVLARWAPTHSPGEQSSSLTLMWPLLCVSHGVRRGGLRLSWS